MSAATGAVPLLYAATKENWSAMGQLAKQAKLPLVVHGTDGLDELAELSKQLQAAGLQDLVLDPAPAILPEPWWR